MITAACAIRMVVPDVFQGASGYFDYLFFAFFFKIRDIFNSTFFANVHATLSLIYRDTNACIHIHKFSIVLPVYLLSSCHPLRKRSLFGLSNYVLLSLPNFSFSPSGKKAVLIFLLLKETSEVLLLQNNISLLSLVFDLLVITMPNLCKARILYQF